MRLEPRFGKMDPLRIHIGRAGWPERRALRTPAMQVGAEIFIHHCKAPGKPPTRAISSRRRSRRSLRA